MPRGHAATLALMAERIFCSLVVLAILLLLPKNYYYSLAASAGNHTDQSALLQFKKGVTDDPSGALASWNASAHFCDWEGVVCDRRRQRVRVLDLHSRGLVGYFSPSLTNLTRLISIYLYNNSLQGPLSPEIGRLARLKVLHLTANSLSGEIPANVSNCWELQNLRLGFNQFVGKIPSELGLLTKLGSLDLHSNNLTGVIPPSFTNLSSLVNLSLALNNLEGSIPADIGRVSKLAHVYITGNSLSGTVPPSLFNISSLYYIAMAMNNLHGTIPEDIGLTLPNLEVLGGGLNNFTGPIPASLSNATGLQTLDFADCFLSGVFPVGFGSLQSIAWLNFGNNSLVTHETDGLSFLASLTNCTNLEVLGLDSNLFTGVLPVSVANLSSHLTMLLLGTNHFSGEFPTGIENYAALTYLSMEGNLFTGAIPARIAKLSSLQKLTLQGNSFFGQIPASLGNMTQLITLRLDGNNLKGEIPPSLGNCQHLQLLNLSHNQLNGTLASRVVGLPSLSLSLNLASNYFVGSIPNEIGNLRSLSELDLSDNGLSGEIPAALGDCMSLERLTLKGNSFQGNIPSSLSRMSGIALLDVSHNNLSGQIPEFLDKFPFLRYLNLSFNSFDGEVPTKGVFGNTSAFSIEGNKNLCGGVSALQLPVCSNKGAPKKKGTHAAIEVVIPVFIGSLCLILVAGFITKYYFSRRSSVKGESTSTIPSAIGSPGIGLIKVTYAELYEATGGFSSANLIGSGGFGCVYKGVNVCGEEVVAIKVLQLHKSGAFNSFMHECDALRNLRHRNLVKIITSCSSLDFSGNGFKALVYEYMPNGDLDKLLHPGDDGQCQLRVLNLVQRVNIAADVASALEYLHYHCHEPVVHCDLKSSNVLLDDDMNARVGDFGLVRFLPLPGVDSKKSQLQNISSAWIKGSIGYVPPEYGMSGRASRLGDVYSYGILLLEMLTGRRPTDEMFTDGHTLHAFAEAAFPDRALEIVDPLLLSQLKADGHVGGSSMDADIRIVECLVSLIRIGILCSKQSRRERMNTKDVSTEVHMVRDIFLERGFCGSPIDDGKGEKSLLSRYSS